MKQMILTLELLEYDETKFPTPALPKVIYKSKRMLFDTDISDKTSIEVLKVLSKFCGLEEVEI